MQPSFHNQLAMVYCDPDYHGETFKSQDTVALRLIKEALSKKGLTIIKREWWASAQIMLLTIQWDKERKTDGTRIPKDPRDCRTNR